MNRSRWLITIVVMFFFSVVGSAGRAVQPLVNIAETPATIEETAVIEEPATIEEFVTPKGTMVEVHYSHYTPWVGGTNCANFSNGQCISNTASGQPWPNWLEIGVACIKEWPFYTKIQAFGKTWTCVDRGGKIRYDDFKYFDGIPWIDFLTAYPQVPYGTIITVEVLP